MTVNVPIAVVATSRNPKTFTIVLSDPGGATLVRTTGTVTLAA